MSNVAPSVIGKIDPVQKPTVLNELEDSENHLRSHGITHYEVLIGLKQFLRDRENKDQWLIKQKSKEREEQEHPVFGVIP